jgi:hypothetical protein
MTRLPLWVRKMVLDAVETFVPTLLLMSLADMNEAGLMALAVAFGAAVMSAARRAWPAARDWVAKMLKVEECCVPGDGCEDECVACCPNCPEDGCCG